MRDLSNNNAAIIVAIFLLTGLAGCASSPPAVPVEDRSMQPAKKPGDATHALYTVRSGDTFWAISRRYGLSVQQLQALNPGVDPGRLETGDVLRLPAGAKPVAVTAPPQRIFSWPLQPVKVSSGYGSRKGKHKGVDLSASKGTKIRAAAAGKVVFAGRNGDYGRVVIIDHGQGYRTLYAHNRKNKVSAGERVKQGQVIATVGASGNASGPHVHFELLRDGRPVNPVNYMR